MDGPFHCQIIQGDKFRVKDKESQRRLGKLNIIKS
jgi:hypothetical protein